MMAKINRGQINLIKMAILPLPKGQNGHIFTIHMMAAIKQENKPYQQATADMFHKSFS